MRDVSWGGDRARQNAQCAGAELKLFPVRGSGNSDDSNKMFQLQCHSTTFKAYTEYRPSYTYSNQKLDHAAHAVSRKLAHAAPAVSRKLATLRKLAPRQLRWVRLDTTISGPFRSEMSLFQDDQDCKKCGQEDLGGRPRVPPDVQDRSHHQEHAQDPEVAWPCAVEDAWDGQARR